MNDLSIILNYIILKPPTSNNFKEEKKHKFDNIKPNFNTLRKISKLNILYESHDNIQQQKNMLPYPLALTCLILHYM